MFYSLQLLHIVNGVFIVVCRLRFAWNEIVNRFQSRVSRIMRFRIADVAFRFIQFIGSRFGDVSFHFTSRAGLVALNCQA